jgi:hypothetical protein
LFAIEVVEVKIVFTPLSVPYMKLEPEIVTVELAKNVPDKCFR